MQTIKTRAFARFEVKRSVFLAHFLPASEFEVALADLKVEHKKAAHFVRALRIFGAAGETKESFSDDGEPSGTSGMPLLFLLRARDLINAGLIVVRYFGGVKLGTGGLSRAYQESARLALGSAKVLPYVQLERAEFAISFQKSSGFENACRKSGAKILAREPSSGFLGLEYFIEAQKEALSELRRTF